MRLRHVLAALATALLPTTLLAQDDATADANNPLASVTAFNIQNYYIGELTGLDDEDGNQFVLRYAKPVRFGDSDWLIRASLPFNSLPVGTGGSTVSGVGDFDIFAAYQVPGQKPGVSFGIGPQLVIPTASDARIGSDQWQIGVANVYFNGTSPVWQYGYLLTYRVGVGDLNGRDRVSLGALQPILFRQLGDGWYTGGAPIWSYNFANDAYSVPVGLRLGKVTQRGDTIYNFFVEPQYSIADDGVGLPKWQVYFALNMQFK